MGAVGVEGGQDLNGAGLGRAEILRGGKLPPLKGAPARPTGPP